MKTIIRTKLIDPEHVEIRDYELGKALKIIHCISTDYKTCSHENDDFMFLPLGKQKSGKIINTQQSKFPPYSYYKILKFKWTPEQQPIREDVNIHKAMTKLAETPEWEKLRQKFHPK